MAPTYKVAVIGAAGGIGQPLSLLLALEPSVRELAVYDVANVGLGADLSHINKNVTVTAHRGPDEADLHACLKGCDFIIMPAGIAKAPGFKQGDTFDRSKLFNINAGIVMGVAKAVAKMCPKAHVCLITNPVNSTLPVLYETLKAAGIERPNVYGVSMLDIVRAMKFVSSKKGNPASDFVYVVGGHSAETIVPIFSQLKHSFTEDELNELTQRVKFGGNEVVEAKEAQGSATLSMAYAAVEFYNRLRSAIEGTPIGEVIAYVRDPAYDSITGGYISLPLKINKDGLEEVLPLPSKLSTLEEKLWNDALAQIKEDIQMGRDFLANQKK